MTITIGYSDAYLNWTASHASPQRANLAVQHILARAADSKVAVEIKEPAYHKGISKAACLVHDRDYVRGVFKGVADGAWGGIKPLQGHTAAVMFEGTRLLVDAIKHDEFASKVYFNPQGAKHHAGYAVASGFCVFNDMAYAAKVFTDMGKKVAYLDWDVHHGDGVENLTRNNVNVLTASIHQWGIFPGTGMRSKRHLNVFNYPMTRGDGDVELMEVMADALDEIREFEPDVILLACGADGLSGDPLGALEYSVEGLTEAAHALGKLAHDLDIPVLIGGAGGYTPYTFTPVAWSETVWAIHEELAKPQVADFDPNDFDWSQHIELDDDDSEADLKRAHVEQIMDQLADFAPDEWEELLTREEYDLVEPIITPRIQEFFASKGA